MTCDTCKWWGKSELDDWHSAAEQDNRKFCGKAIGNRRDLPEDGMSPFDCEDYHAGLLTGPKFGCIHHQFA